MSKTNVYLIIDESGSMDPQCDETILGVNHYLDTLREDKKNTYTITLVTFDSQARMIYNKKPLSKVGKFTEYSPKGYTALYDGIGLAIGNVPASPPKGKRLVRDVKTHQEYYATAVQDTAEKNACVIITDGGENYSKIWSSDHIRQIIKALEEDASWAFIFMGANADAWGNANRIGMVRYARSYDVNQSYAGYDALGGGTVAYSSGGSVMDFAASAGAAIPADTSKSK